MVKRHNEYFIQGGDLFLLAENCLFRVHRYFFLRESVYFKKNLVEPMSPAREENGSSANPFVVDVQVGELEKFLWVFYNPQYDLYDSTVDHWTTILRLADKWDFPRVKDLAIRQLNKLEMPDVERIALYQSCGVDKALLVPWLASLCKREQPLSIDEGEKLTIRTAITLARAREVLRSPMSDKASSPLRMEEPELRALVLQTFQIPDNLKGKQKEKK